MQISDKKACIPGNAYFRTSAGCTGKARRSRICFINIQSWKTKNSASVDVNNHIAQHHLQTKHQIQWDSATCITYSTDYYIRLTLKIRFTYLEQRQRQQLPVPIIGLPVRPSYKFGFRSSVQKNGLPGGGKTRGSGTEKRCSHN